MTERASPSGWLEQSRHKLDGTPLAPQAEAVGRVVHVADGIARITGLPDTVLGALLRFEGGQLGFAHGLGADRIDAVILDETSAIEAGQSVTDTCAFPSARRCWVGSSILSAVRWTAVRPWRRNKPCRWSALRPRS
jgi:F-type H+-transporting ATPase subunit alpha